MLYTPDLLQLNPWRVAVLLPWEEEHLAKSPQQGGPRDGRGGGLYEQDEERGGLVHRYRSGDMAGVQVLRNVAPEWDDEAGAFTLPFYSRVHIPSRRNLQLIDPQAPENVLFLFGKQSKRRGDEFRRPTVTTYSLDFCKPVSCLAAFAIALSTFQNPGY